jgi:hypothetical protein
MMGGKLIEQGIVIDLAALFPQRALDPRSFTASDPRARREDFRDRTAGGFKAVRYDQAVGKERWTRGRRRSRLSSRQSNSSGARSLFFRSLIREANYPWLVCTLIRTVPPRVDNPQPGSHGSG